MRPTKLTKLNFMTLCCVLGLITKKLINPFANVITESLHIPGGISTGFSIMFLVIAAEMVRKPGQKEEKLMQNCGTLMGLVQGLLALCLGRVGSMGLLAPIGYLVPGMSVDLVYRLSARFGWSRTDRMVFANGLGAVMASVTANLLVFRLHGPVLVLYFGVSALSGTLYGFLGSAVAGRLGKHFGKQ